VGIYILVSPSSILYDLKSLGRIRVENDNKFFKKKYINGCISRAQQSSLREEVIVEVNINEVDHLVNKF
jgi:hypothetical protein